MNMGGGGSANEFYWSMLYSEWMFSRTDLCMQQLILTKPSPVIEGLSNLLTDS